MTWIKGKTASMGLNDDIVRTSSCRRLNNYLLLSKVVFDYYVTDNINNHHRFVDNRESNMSRGTALFDLTGKRALITGSSQGIGLTLARGLCEAGATVVLNGRTETKLEAAEETLLKQGFNVEKSRFDVTSHEQVVNAVTDICSAYGDIDILVNNAGMQHRTPLEDFDPEVFNQMLQTNIASVFHVGQTVAKQMISRGKGGKIINIASVQSALARPGIAPYTATKGAVANLTKGMATDWAQYGLQINAIAPGYFDTPLNAALVADKDFSAWLEKRTPSGRWGQLDELIGAGIFLSSDASSFVNGHILYVDGGITACL